MRKVIVCLVCCLFIVGCAEQQGQIAAARDILLLAREDKVRGRMQLTLNGGIEAGLKEGVYFGSPGSRLDADLTFDISDISPEENK